LPIYFNSNQILLLIDFVIVSSLHLLSALVP